MAEEQPSRVERRLAAILAADVVGYSQLMGTRQAPPAFCASIAPPLMRSSRSMAGVSSRPRATACSSNFLR